MNSVETLFKLLKNHQYDDFVKLLDDTDEIDVNYHDANGNYLIQYGILFNKKNIVSLLINKGARLDVTDSDGRSVVYTAVKYNYLDILSLLLHFNQINIGVSLVDIKDRIGNIPLHYAIFAKNVKATEMLLDAGSDCHITDKRGNMALHLAIYTKSIELIELILEHTKNLNLRTKLGETPLHLACNFQQVSIVEKLLKRGADPNLKDYDNELTPLNYVINLGHVELVNLLIFHKADVIIQDVYGNSALHYVIIEDNLEIFNSLLHQTEYPDDFFILQNLDGHTPLHLAIQNKSRYQDHYLKDLIKHSKVNIQDNLGNTAMHLLIIFELWESYIPLLKEKKMDIFVRNLEGKRVVDLISLSKKSVFIKMVAESYLFRLRDQTDKDDRSWEHEWQTLCQKTQKMSALTTEQKKLFGKHLKQSSSDVCLDHIIEMLKQEIATPRCCSLSYPRKKKDHGGDFKLEEGKTVSHCTYSGVSLDIIIGMLYLLEKYPRLGMPLTKNFVDNPYLAKRYDDMGFATDELTEFMNFEVVWIDGKMYFPTYFDSVLNQLLQKKQIRFIAIPLGIQITAGSHANYLLYDKKLKQLERFEPNGSEPPYQFRYNHQVLDEIIKSKFIGFVPDLEYFPPESYLPKIGFQYLDSYDRKNRKIGDPGGFCAIWTVWYVDMRLRYPDLSRKSLVKKIIKHSKKNNLSFRNIIRNYTAEIVKLRDTILQKANIDINDWINDNIKKAQTDKIVQEIQQKIILLVASK